MKKYIKTTALILSALMFFGCTSNAAKGNVGDTTPPSESSVSENNSVSKTENSASDYSAVSDTSKEDTNQNLVENIEGYQTFSYNENENIILNFYEYGKIDIQQIRISPFEPTMENIKEHSYVSIEPIAVKCRVVGDSYNIYKGKCGDVQVMGYNEGGTYTPVVIEAILDDGGNESVFKTGDIVYIKEYYGITAPFKGSIPYYEREYNMALYEYETESGELTSGYNEDPRIGYYELIKNSNGKYINNLFTPVAMQKGESYLVFINNDKTPNETDKNIYAKNYHIIFDLERDKPSIHLSEDVDNQIFTYAQCYSYQWKILKEKYSEYFKK